MAGKNKGEVVAEVCLYGAASCGHGYRAMTKDSRHFGTGDPVPQTSATEALFKACRELSDAGVGQDQREPMVVVYATSGLQMALTSLRHPAYVGDLKWIAARTYEIPLDELLAAAEQPS